MMNTEMIEAIRNAPKVSMFHYMQMIKEGMVIEFGVHVGSTLKIIFSQTDRVVYGFDSFEGLPEYWTGAGGLPAGHFACDPPIHLRENVILVTGWFEDTVPPFCERFKDEKVAFMHIDCDVGSGARTVLNNFKEKNMFQDGTIIVFDEIMGYPEWEKEEFAAFNDFLDETGYKWECIGMHGGDPNNLELGGEVKAAFRIYK
jgi:hypothetical protein